MTPLTRSRTSPRTAAPRILVVDDDADIARLTCDLIKRRFPKARVMRRTDPERALAAAIADPPDLLVVDWQMPGIDGLALCRRLSADPATAHTRILAMSGHIETRGLNEAFFESGAAEFIRKPFEPHELRASVERALRDWI